jgi:SAM-dependent methyltransferase
VPDGFKARRTLAVRESIRTAAGKIITKDGRLWSSLRDLYYRSRYYLPGECFNRVRRRVNKSGIFYREQELYMCSLDARKTLEKTLELFSPSSVLDLGCGTGKSLDYFLDRGIDAFGVEGSELAISKALHPELIRQWNLNEELNRNRKFDLTWCYEVVEHVHPKYVNNLMRTFSNHSDRVVLSAAPPGQGGEGHFNEQPPSYWRALFESYGFGCDERATEALHGIDEIFSQNMLVFERSAR